jgi:hypothetical protein
MDISPKTRRYLTESVEYRLTWYDAELAKKDLADDQRTELAERRAALKEIHEELTRGRMPTKPGHA